MCGIFCCGACTLQLWQAGSVVAAHRLQGLCVSAVAVHGPGCSEACGIVVLPPGIKPESSALQDRLMTRPPPLSLYPLKESQDFHHIMLLCLQTKEYNESVKASSASSSSEHILQNHFPTFPGCQCLYHVTPPSVLSRTLIRSISLRQSALFSKNRAWRGEKNIWYGGKTWEIVPSEQDRVVGNVAQPSSNPWWSSG